MSSTDSTANPNSNDRLPSTPIRPRVFHIVSPLTGSKATIITTDQTSSPNHGPVFIQAAQRIIKPSSNAQTTSQNRKRLYPFGQETTETTTYLSNLAAHRHRERLSKGLRYFSKKVCNKVQMKKITSYNEVATELVTEYTMEEKRSLQLTENELAYEQKNIRRRVYDAINVLLAMNIIVKDKKDIRWVGFPVNALFECDLIDKKILEKKIEIREKIQSLENAMRRQIALINLIRRNETRPKPKSTNEICLLPFFALKTTNGASIEHFLSRDGRKTILTFDRRVTFVDENEILQRRGFSSEFRGETKSKDEIERICSVVPPVFHQFAIEMATNGSLKKFIEKRDLSSGKNAFDLEDFDEPDDDEDEAENDDDDDDVLSLSSNDDEQNEMRRKTSSR